jgi:hypothetical protein
LTAKNLFSERTFIVKKMHQIGLISVLTLLGVSALRAKDLAAYHVGDVAQADITTPVALDVVDPAATAALKSADAMRTPAIFRICSATTNRVAGEFLAEFAVARSNFTAAILDTYHQATLDATAIAAPDFGYFVTAFNIKNKSFPITTGLAATWARGNPGLTEQKRLLDFLLLTMQHPVRPDDLPENFVAGEIVRLVPVNDANEPLTLNEAVAGGKLVTAASLSTLTQLRIIFQREFADDDQPMARALTLLLQPNCLPDAGLTKLAREGAVQHLTVADHYDAGQIIVRQGLAIDEKIKIALDQMDATLATSPNPPVIAGRDETMRQEPPALPSEHLPQKDASKKTGGTNPEQGLALNFHANVYLLAAALAAVSSSASLMLWRLISRRQASASLTPVRAINLQTHDATALHAELAPHLAELVKDAMVQELSVQRRELLVAQQMATAEIIRLVQRLDGLQMTMQERLQAYEMQIQKLEKELALRAEENNELLKLKIEMTRQQLEAERARHRLEFN